MTQKLPAGVTCMLVFNFISIALFILLSFMLLVMGDPNQRIALPLFGLVPAALLFWLNKGLSQLKPRARICQIIPSSLGLLIIPTGTILGGISLYFLLLHEPTKSAFQKPTTPTS